MIAASAAAVMLSACAPTVVPAGGAVETPRLTEDRYVAADGTSLPLSVWPAANGAPRAVILALHGFGDYRMAWEEPAGTWSGAGITTYAYDQRGFGGSPDPWPLAGHRHAGRGCQDGPRPSYGRVIPACRSTSQARAWAARWCWWPPFAGPNRTG
jgi:pimeloyl-ACP methyl ester carboxylesterase